MANTPVVIERDKPREPAFDYEQLRREAIAHVQQLSGKIWTDYNLHDPGVTILEQLCYAITDLAYRTGFPIEEILADRNGDIDPLLHAFFSRADMLSSAPVTAADFCKLVLDEVDEVENIWVEPVKALQPGGAAKGVYRVFLQVEDALAANIDASAATVQSVVDAVRRCLMSYRNIGQDVEDITVLRPQQLAVKAEILVDSRFDAQEIAAHVCNAFEFALHPPVRFFTEAELVAKGYKVEDIYTGPLLKKGFVTDGDLSARKTMVDPSELVKAVSLVPGVMKVKTLYVAGEDGNYTARPIMVKEGCYPFLTIPGDMSDIKVFSDRYEYRLKDVQFRNTYQKMKIIAKRKFVGQRTGHTQPPLKAAWRNISQYYSLQHHFPGIYGIGAHGLDSAAPERRKAQAKQLKAYLLFFEQLLANYLAQLGSMGDFFSPLLPGTPPYTYASQPLYSVPDIQPLIRAFTEQDPHKAMSWEQFMEDNNNGYMKAMRKVQETDKVYQERKNRVLDHLLARFNLHIMKYPAALYEQVYNGPSSGARVSAELEWKAGILQHAGRLTANRLRSFNYREDIFNPGTLSGYEEWLYRLLYIPVEQRTRLTAAFDAEHLQVAVGKRQPEHMHFWLVKEYEVKGEVLKVAMEEPPEMAAEQPVRYDFGSQPLSFLRTGLSMDNYRIAFDEERREYLVVCRQPHHEVWRIVIRADKRAKAEQALQDMLEHLKQISKNSEGFYLVEHVLLKPRYTERAFGYHLYDRDGKLLRSHPYWCTFEEREQQLQQLQEEAARQQGYFEYFIKQDTYGNMLPEDFFRFGLTVVLPAWPARFQLHEFRDFAEGLFREQTPAQFRIQFKWLGVGAMRAFEEDYFKWLQAMKDQQELPAANAALIKHIKAGN
ncbi:hypothetical protein [Chitinophaga japonensis]|uniref:Uncharacterized protein n=1 Tax=Chitinophaga japonensis TaxID=104662 RepID=A0A562STV1_CHIJA|nr:hypothetical protein [Chitinophaga japonensis]TWI84523.1 hypothetical protein LX66_4893 [Chitinophaga japonensis]